MFRSFFIGLLVFALLWMALVMLLEDTLIYFPVRYSENDNLWDTSSFEFPVEDVWFAASDGVKLHAWWSAAAAPAPAPAASAEAGVAVAHDPWVVLYIHGNGGHLAHRDFIVMTLHEAGFSVFMFDFRGYGRSEGTPSEAGVYRDAEAAWDWLVKEKGIDPKRIISFGTSLGAGVAADVATKREVAAVILETPFTNIRDMAAETFGGALGWVGAVARSKFDTLAKVRDIHVPLLVIHGDQDSIVPNAHGRRIFEAANEPKSFYEIPGADHNDTWFFGGTPYIERLKEFAGTLTK